MAKYKVYHEGCVIVLSVIVAGSKLCLISDKRPQITQDLDSSFKCTGCNVSKITFLNRTPVLTGIWSCSDPAAGHDNFFLYGLYVSKITFLNNCKS